MSEIDEGEVARKVEEVLTKKGPDGEYVYTQQEVRDFIVATIFEMGLDIPFALQNAVLTFIVDIGCDEETPNDELVLKIAEYFATNPLNPLLLAELATWGRDTLFSQDHEGYAKATEQIKALQAAGSKNPTKKAPEVEPKKIEVKGKVKKGLG